eukprot:SAG31_NODE_363_length_16899_cov_9.812976_2_plen_124_part_00
MPVISARIVLSYASARIVSVRVYLLYLHASARTRACTLRIIHTVPRYRKYEYKVRCVEIEINLNLGLRRVLSVFANFIPSEQINNYAFNGMATYDIRQKDRSEADTTEVIFTWRRLPDKAVYP